MTGGPSRAFRCSPPRGRGPSARWAASSSSACGMPGSGLNGWRFRCSRKRKILSWRRARRPRYRVVAYGPLPGGPGESGYFTMTVRMYGAGAGWFAAVDAL